MKINICNIYKNNILNKYNDTNRDSFLNDFTPKQREMLRFTLELIKDGFPKSDYDSVKDAEYLNGYLELYLCEKNIIRFTIKEWFEYLKSIE